MSPRGLRFFSPILYALVVDTPKIAKLRSRRTLLLYLVCWMWFSRVSFKRGIVSVAFSSPPAPAPTECVPSVVYFCCSLKPWLSTKTPVPYRFSFTLICSSFSRSPGVGTSRLLSRFPHFRPLALFFIQFPVGQAPLLLCWRFPPRVRQLQLVDVPRPLPITSFQAAGSRGRDPSFFPTPLPSLGFVSSRTPFFRPSALLGHFLALSLFLFQRPVVDLRRFAQFCCVN